MVFTTLDAIAAVQTTFQSKSPKTKQTLTSHTGYHWYHGQTLLIESTSTHNQVTVTSVHPPTYALLHKIQKQYAWKTHTWRCTIHDIPNSKHGSIHRVKYGRCHQLCILHPGTLINIIHGTTKLPSTTGASRSCQMSGMTNRPSLLCWGGSSSASALMQPSKFIIMGWRSVCGDLPSGPTCEQSREEQMGQQRNGQRVNAQQTKYVFSIHSKGGYPW